MIHLDGMRARMMCRRLAGDIIDAQASEVLLQMAHEIEVDLAKLEAEREAHVIQLPPEARSES